MKVLFLCGVFAKENEQEVIKHSKRAVEFSANVFQERMIRGLEELSIDFDVISAPFIGSYPNASDLRFFGGFTQTQSTCKYVDFNNIWGIRNISRAMALKKEVRAFAQSKDEEKLIVVYSPHTPFLAAASFAKKFDSNIRICLVVPDLPQYMNLNSKVSFLYRVGKFFDIAKFMKLNRWVDSYVLLTEAMKEKLDTKGKPYIVREGIISSEMLCPQSKTVHEEENRLVVYTGKLNQRFGVCNLVDAFTTLENSTYRLILCGTGDAQKYAMNQAENDSRIRVLGQVTPEEASQWVAKADVLVNPRQNNEEYTKYSFPSKNIEYLSSGNPVVAYMLDGMAKEYSEIFYIVDGNETNDLGEAIERALLDSKEHQVQMAARGRARLEQLTEVSFMQSILKLNAW